MYSDLQKQNELLHCQLADVVSQLKTRDRASIPGEVRTDTIPAGSMDVTSPIPLL